MPYPAYLDLPARLASLTGEAVAAYVRHAQRPNAQGAEVAHQKLWAAAYECRAALREQNPSFAASLLPTTATPVVAGVGLPLVPAGVRWAVDEQKPGTLTVSVDVAGSPTLIVTTPSGDVLRPVLSAAATRQVATFAAPLDGLYVLTLDLSGAHLATLYVSVSRAEFALFREDVRAAGYGFRLKLPRLSADATTRLARLAQAEAAARTAQPALAASLLAAARAVPAAPTPTAIFPYRQDD